MGRTNASLAPTFLRRRFSELSAGVEARLTGWVLENTQRGLDNALGLLRAADASRA